MISLIIPFKLGIHLRQRQAKAQRGSLSLARVDSATNRATCLKRLPQSETLVVGRSKWGKDEEFYSSCAIWTEHTTNWRNWKTFFSTRGGAPRMPTARLASASCVLAALEVRKIIRDPSQWDQFRKKIEKTKFLTYPWG